MRATMCSNPSLGWVLTLFELIPTDDTDPAIRQAALAFFDEINANALLDAVTDAVNKGSIHRYIAKPWDNKALAETVKAGLEQHELVMENHRLFALAKEQNTKLYTVNMELKKGAAVHKKAIVQKDKQISELNTRLEKGFENRNYINEMEALLKEKQLLDKEKLDSLYLAIIAELYEQFQDIATRNGFEMPENIPA